MVYRNIDDALPLYLNDSNAKVEMGLTDLSGTGGKVSGAYETHIRGLAFQLSELNENIVFEFRMAYLVYQSHPCEEQAAFSRRVENMSLRLSELYGARLQFQALVELASTRPDDNAEVWEAFSRIAGVLGGPEFGKAASTAIRSSRANVQLWIAGQSRS